MSRDGTAKLLNTIHRLYAASVDQDAWPEALQSTQDLLGGHASILHLADAGDRSTLSTISSNVPHEMLSEYEAHYVHQDCRLAYNLENPSPEVQYDYLHTDERRMRKDGFYDWLGKADFRYYLGGRVLSRGGAHAYFGVQRSRKEGHVGQEEIEFYRALHPHLSRAVEVSVHLREARLSADASHSVMESSRHGVAILGMRGELIYANERLRAMAASENGIELSANRGLQAARTADDELLQRLLGSAARTAQGMHFGGGGHMTIPKRGGARPYGVLVAPQRMPDAGLAIERPAVLVFVSDPDKAFDLSRSELRSHFGLTEREAQVAKALAEGLAVSEIAATIGTAEKTVRVHLERIYRKTGAKGQVDLLRRVRLTCYGWLSTREFPNGELLCRDSLQFKAMPSAMDCPYRAE